MTRWRKRPGEAGAEALLKTTLDTCLKIKVITPAQVERVNADSTEQTNAVRFPTHARRYDRAREQPGENGPQTRAAYQTKLRAVGPAFTHGAGPLSPCRQKKRTRACTRKLRSLLGRVTREINALLSAAAMNFQKLLGFFLCCLLDVLLSLFVPASRDQFLAVMH